MRLVISVEPDVQGPLTIVADLASRVDLLDLLAVAS